MSTNTWDEDVEDVFSEYDDDTESGEAAEEASVETVENEAADEPAWEEEVIEDDDSDEGEGVIENFNEPILMQAPTGEIIDIANPALTYEEAQELTESIRTTADTMFLLISRAHAGKAYLALGYSSFQEYVKVEFDISRSRAYQLLDQAKVIHEIEQVSPEGTQIRISEAQARDLKKNLEYILPQIQDRTASLGEDEDPNEAINELLQGLRDEGESDADSDDFDVNLDDFGDGLDGTGGSHPEEFDGDYADRAGFSGSSGGGSGGGGGGHDGDDGEDFDDLDDLDALLDFDDDPNNTRKQFESVYALYTALGSLKELPDARQVAEWISDERKIQITASLPRALKWLEEFQEIWDAEYAEGYRDNSDDTDDEE